MGLGYEDGFAPARVAVLLKAFAQLDDDREPWRVMYPLAEVLLLVTCATVASCDDFDDIVAFGKHHLHDLRGYAPFHHGVPCACWIRALVNRIDPDLFAACFESWIKAMWPDRHDLIAIVLRRAQRLCWMSSVFYRFRPGWLCLFRASRRALMRSRWRGCRP